MGLERISSEDEAANRVRACVENLNKAVRELEKASEYATNEYGIEVTIWQRKVGNLSYGECECSLSVEI